MRFSIFWFGVSPGDYGAAYHRGQDTREAAVTVSDLDRLHSQLSKLEDIFPGYVTEIVEEAS